MARTERLRPCVECGGPLPKHKRSYCGEGCRVAAREARAAEAPPPPEPEPTDRELLIELWRLSTGRPKKIYSGGLELFTRWSVAEIGPAETMRIMEWTDQELAVLTGVVEASSVKSHRS